MAIWLDENSRIVVQGITGGEGSKHTRRMLAAGAKVVAGVNARKVGQQVEGVPVFGSVADAMAETGANVSVIFVPPKFTKDAAIEAVDAAIPLAVVITEGVPVHDTTEFFAYSQSKGTTRIIGPNCPGIASPGASN
ncbi:CoA-binding protein, partial [Frankia sp. EI5c]|uniref:CoA-binding protein n=1 Tax=Frankia sp. EI5c TaxID=683316 RepID=UPI0037C06D20